MLLFTTWVCWPDWQKVNNGWAGMKKSEHSADLLIFWPKHLRFLLLISPHHIYWPVQTKPSLMWSFMLLQLHVAVGWTSRALHPHSSDPHLRTIISGVNSFRLHSLLQFRITFLCLTHITSQSKIYLSWVWTDPTSFIQNNCFLKKIIIKKKVRIQLDPWSEDVFCH